MFQVRHSFRADLGIDSQASAAGRSGKVKSQMPNRTQRRAEDVPERRVSNRLPIERDLRYKVLGSKKRIKQIGSGKTLNMSSGGVLFTTESDLLEGERVEIAVSWPAQLNDAIPLKFVAVGVLVRAKAAQAALSIERYEFRTRGLSL
jgi:hypothetical protein